MLTPAEERVSALQDTDIYEYIQECTQREKLSFGKGVAHVVGILDGRRVAPRSSGAAVTGNTGVRELGHRRERPVSCY